MPSPNRSPAWQALVDHHKAAGAVHLRDLLTADAGRTESLSFSLDGLFLDLSKNRITGETLTLLLALAEERDVAGQIRAMAGGKRVNITEDRAALHMALRAEAADGFAIDGAPVHGAVADVQEHMAAFAHAIETGTRTGATGKPFTDVVNIGIGGSDQGPRLACRALAPYLDRNGLTPHFVSNVDSTDLAETLDRCNPETTLIIVSSKTFTTQETMTNAASARSWLTEALGADAVAAHFCAVTANGDAARAFGIDDDARFPIWNWVGGRYSVWSAIGLPIVLGIGMDNFRAFLAGARAMDRHFLETPFERNLPVLLALVGIWNSNFEGAAAHAVLPYGQLLDGLPAYLQQLEMESNGKSVDVGGNPVTQDTAPVIFGQAGTNGQHAFYQLLHQGTALVSSDCIAAARHPAPMGDHHEKLLANFLAQPAALALGRVPDPDTPAHKAFSGNRPSTTILCDQLDPRTLGSLLALYEHKVFVQAAIWNINPFDQFGVELGKELATPLESAVSDGRVPAGLDSSTRNLLSRIHRIRDGGETP
ncbi:MAG: glucose-6-phosphate isomerase [Rhodospirillales bacterium]